MEGFKDASGGFRPINHEDNLIDQFLKDREERWREEEQQQNLADADIEDSKNDGSSGDEENTPMKTMNGEVTPKLPSYVTIK